MFITQYTHRLPADYDMSRIRERASTRGPDWDSYPGLIFKGFLIQEKGKLGAEANAYSSLYLWSSADAFAAMISGDRFQAVIDAFGRPGVETFVVLASSFGPARSARFARRSDDIVPAQANLAALKEEEMKWALAEAGTEETLAAITALDSTRWQLARFTLSASQAPSPDVNQRDYEIAYLAAPDRR
jgi:Domain of unknown function (DUF4865)